MRKLYTLLFAALAGWSAASAEGTLTLTTNAPVGTEIKILPNVTSATKPITIDFGDGVAQNFTVDPNKAAYNRWIKGVVKGTTIVVKGNLTEFNLQEAQLATAKVENMDRLTKLDLAHNELTSFELGGYTPLTSLNLSYNQIYNSPTDSPTLTLENCGETLTDLNLSHNDPLQCLDARYFDVIEYLTLNNCADFASIFICLPEESQNTLRNINLSNCSLSNFYPVSLPNLRTLDLRHNNLMTDYTDVPFEFGDYPKLTSLTVSANPGIRSLDVTKFTKLENLYCDSCNISTLDISQAPDLITLNCSENNISTLDLGNNPNITGLLVAGNPIKELNMDHVQNISTLNISNTQISRIDLMKAFYLKDFRAANTLLEFVDFNGQQANRLTRCDLSNNPNFTYESMAYTLKTLPQARKAYSTNLFLTGSNAEKSDTERLKDGDMQWIPDVEGDGSAEWSDLNVTLVGCTDTGENKTGTVDRLYPYFGYSMPYDLDVMETTGGKFIICQWQSPWFQNMESVHTSAMKGVPVCVYSYPEEGKRFKSVTVNGKEIYSNWFIISEDATIKVNFSGEMESISFDVTQGSDFTFLVNTAADNGSVFVDWGTGTRTEYTGQNGYTSGYTRIGGTRIDGTAASDKITVYGDIAAIDVSGFGDVAADFGLWDNHITGIDVTNCPSLKFLNAYWNPISTIDLSNNAALEVLNLSYTALKSIDLSANTNLLSLELYSDGFGDEEDGICQISALDVSNMPELQQLVIKNQNIASLDLTNNTKLHWADIFGNKLTSIDLSKNTQLLELKIGRNQLTSVDLSANTMLTDLSVDDNSLTTLDLSNNIALESLSFAGNQIHDIDLHYLAALKKLWINDNGMTAEELNDIYYRLPQRIADDDEEGNSYDTKWNLVVIQGVDDTPNDGYNADSSIAVDRGWTSSQEGTNSGCDNAYLDILSSPNGTSTVTDDAGNTYAHGSKVPKYTTLTINATPAEGYCLKGYSLNGEELTEGSTFTMPGIYTKLCVTFAKGSGIDATDSDAATATADVYTLSGARVATGVTRAQAAETLTPGIYMFGTEKLIVR